MNTHEIRLELFKVRKSKTMTAIARDLEVSKTAVSRVAAGSLKSRRIMTAIAHAIGKDPKYVWPDEFFKKRA